jgi:hypothetical protein
MTIVPAGLVLLAIALLAAFTIVWVRRLRRTVSSSVIDAPHPDTTLMLRSVRLLRTAEEIADATNRLAFSGARADSPARRPRRAVTVQPKEAP